MTAQAMEQTDREWVENAPRFFINEKECVEAWYACELFTRLKMILFVVANFDPGRRPCQDYGVPERVGQYRQARRAGTRKTTHP